jgi:hypothetical protein
VALPTIVINSSGGSDSLASGAGPGTAVTGTLAATHANTTVNITDAVALGGVATDGSAVLWVSSSSGKQFAKITAITGSSGNWTVTVSDAYANTESGRNWAIGGTRATLSGSTQLGTDCRSGWTIDLQSDDTFTANFNLKPNAVADQWTVLKSSNSTRPTISTSTNSIYGLDIQGANQLVIQHIHFKSTAGTPGNGISPAGASAASMVVVADCVIEGFSSGTQDHDNGGNVDVTAMIITGCEIKSCGTGISNWAGCQVAHCYVHSCTSAGMTVQATRQRSDSISHCVFDSNTKYGVDFQTASNIGVLVTNCVFSNTTVSATIGVGLHILATGGAMSMTVRDSIFYGNATYGISSDQTNVDAVYITNCAFGSNSTANVLTPFTTGVSPVTLTANPFVSSSDFGLNSTAGGGAACKGAASTIPSATANAAGDIGAVPSGGGAGAAVVYVVYPQINQYIINQPEYD